MVARAVDDARSRRPQGTVPVRRGQNLGKDRWREALAAKKVDNLELFLLDLMDFCDFKGHNRGLGVRKAYGVLD